MVPHLRSFVAVAAVVLAREASAQTSRGSLIPIAYEVSASAGRLFGTVQDESGTRLKGVQILAVGATLALVRTDATGRFHLELPVGHYLVRAERPGYVSTYREIVQVPPGGSVERTIRLMTAGAHAQPGVASSPAAVPAPAPLVEDGTGRGDVAWRLRHLRRTVLRDVSPSAIPEAQTAILPGSAATSMASLVDWAIQGSSRIATALLANTDFTGQVNVFTMRSVSLPDGPSAADWSRGIANVIIGAPVGVTGDWSVRGAMLAGDTSSWTLVGDYEARDDQRHKVHVGFSFATQGFVAGRELPMSVVVPESRSAGGFHASDRWQLRPSLDLEYGMRFDRYDYLSELNLFSPRVAVRAKAFRRVFVVASTSQRMIAPGADEFLPPSSSAPWLPPTRTFSSLPSSAPLRPQQVRSHAVGIEHTFGEGRGPTVRVERFSQATHNQLATLYGLDPASEVGHYYIATAGHVDVTGWRVRLGGKFSTHVRGTMEFASGEARWTGTKMASALRRHAPSLARRGLNQISDFRTSIDMTVPQTATHIAVVYRLNTADRGLPSQVSAPIGEGRFNLELSQRLPYQPLDSGMLNLLFTLRTLRHDDEAGSLYDEVLTLRPPTRLTGGLQVRF